MSTSSQSTSRTPIEEVRHQFRRNIDRKSWTVAEALNYANALLAAGRTEEGNVDRYRGERNTARRELEQAQASLRTAGELGSRVTTERDQARQQLQERNTAVTRLETQLREANSQSAALQTTHNLCAATLDSTQRAARTEIDRLKKQVRELEEANDGLKAQAVTSESDLSALRQAREKLEQQLRKRPTSEQLEAETAKRVKAETDLKRVSGQFDVKQATVHQLQGQLESQQANFQLQADKAQEQWTAKVERLKQAGRQLKAEAEAAEQQLTAVKRLLPEESWKEHPAVASTLLQYLGDQVQSWFAQVPTEFHKEPVNHEHPLLPKICQAVNDTLWTLRQEYDNRQERLEDWERQTQQTQPATVKHLLATGRRKAKQLEDVFKPFPKEISYAEGLHVYIRGQLARLLAVLELPVRPLADYQDQFDNLASGINHVPQLKQERIRLSRQLDECLAHKAHLESLHRPQTPP